MRQILPVKKAWYAFYFAIAALLSWAAYSSVQALNLDGIQYISIAQHYADGHWKEAINGYWSPLLSWLLTPFLALGVDGQIASRILLVLFALATLLLGQRIVGEYSQHQGRAYAIYFLSTIPLAVTAVSGVISPDLLVVIWILTLMLVLSRAYKRKDRSKRTLVLVGLLGGAGFLVKAFLLPFFVVAVGTWMLLFREGGSRTPLIERLKRFGLVFAGLLLIVGTWSALLSLKYEKVTTGSTGSYNMAYVGPESVKHPARNEMLPPSNEFAYSPMEDPTWHPYVRWSPAHSLADFRYYLTYLFEQNIPAVHTTLFNLSLFIPGIFLMIVALLALNKVNLAYRAPLTLVAIFCLTYTFGYYATHVVGGGRYLWPVLVLIIIAVSILGSIPYRPDRLLRKALVGILIVAFALPMYVNLSTFLKLRAYASEQSLHRLGQLVKENTEPRSTLASNSLTASVRIAYAADLKGYGAIGPKDSLTDQGTQSALRKHDIDYFLYVERPDRPEDISGFEKAVSTTMRFDDPRAGFPGAVYKVYLLKLP